VAGSNGPERRRATYAQSTHLEVDAIGVFPGALFLVFLLTLVGVVAHAAFV
jgi:hypothetical protein